MRLPTPQDSRGWMQRLSQLFEAMDDAYSRAAAAYGFLCTGCEDNCCMTRFHHHTLLEYLSLNDGLAQLPDAVTAGVAERAANARSAAGNSMCPLNEAGRCLTYAHRPMICRMHGIPHELHRPDGEVIYGPGCDAFSRRCGRQACVPFDRTPHYHRMAALEGELRKETGFSGKIRMTVVEIILSIAGGPLKGVEQGNPGGRE